MKRRRQISRPRYIALGDKRCPMLRLLQDCYSQERGTVEVDYEQQWRTFFKAQRLGFIDGHGRMTDLGTQFISGCKAA